MRIFFLCKRAKKEGKIGAKRKKLGGRREELFQLGMRNEKLGIGGRVWQEAKTLPHRRKRIFENYHTSRGAHCAPADELRNIP